MIRQMGRDGVIFTGLIVMLLIGVAWVSAAILRISHHTPRRR